MKVLFIYPNRVMVTRMPLGLAYLASYLKRDGHQVEIFDTTYIKCSNIPSDDALREATLQVRNPDFKKYGLTEEENVNVFDRLRQALDSFKPDIVGITVVDPNFMFAMDLLRAVKKWDKGLMTVAGGPTPTYAPDEVIAQDCVDALFVGEAEESFLELVNKIDNNEDHRNVPNMWIRDNGTVIKNCVRELPDTLNDLLPPDWSIFDQRHLIRPLAGQMYRMGIFQLTRGCLFRCRYCSNFALAKTYKGMGRYYRFKEPELFAKEVAAFRDAYNLDFIFFTDDLFPLHDDELLDGFCEQYKKHVGLPFNVSLYPELIKEEPFAKLVDAGCVNVCMGLESGSHELRKKFLKRGYKNERVTEVVHMMTRHGVRVSTFNMMGVPHETRENVFETIDLNRQAKPTTCTITFFHPYRGTELRDLSIKEKFYDPSKETSYEDLYRTDSQLDLPNLSKETLHGLMKTFQMYVKLPKAFYPLIRIAEKETRTANVVYNALKWFFYRFTDKEQRWDFSAAQKYQPQNGIPNIQIPVPVSGLHRVLPATKEEPLICQA